MIRQLIEQQTAAREQQAASDARWEQRLAAILPVGGPPPQHGSTPKTFKMTNPAKFCGGADDLDRFITQVQLLFESHSQHFPRGDPDKVQYAMSLLGSWKENVDEGLRKTQMTHPNQWSSELQKAQAECLGNWDLFETEIREMYGDPDRQLDASTRAYVEYAQGALDSNETVKSYSNRLRSTWREAGWKVDQKDAHQILYDMVWAGLRPGIKARVKPFTGETGRFSSIDELFKRARDVEIKSNRDRDRRVQPVPTAEKNIGKDKKRPHPSSSVSRDSVPTATTQSTGGSSNRDTQSHAKLPPAPWVEYKTMAKRKERGWCRRCGDSKHHTTACTKYSRPIWSQNSDRDHDREDRQDREKRPKPTDAQQAKN